MKQVIQLTSAGYFVGVTIADESPLEPGVFHLPHGCVDAPIPKIPEGMVAKWEDESWLFESISEPEVVAQPEPVEISYAEKRAMEYPPIGDQLDALWKGGDAAIEMLAAVRAVKAKYPKPESQL